MALKLRNFVFYVDITIVVYLEFASPREPISRLSTVALGILGATVSVCVLIATAFVIFIIRCVVNDLSSLDKYLLNMDN